MKKKKKTKLNNKHRIVEINQLRCFITTIKCVKGRYIHVSREIVLKIYLRLRALQCTETCEKRVYFHAVVTYIYVLDWC